MHIRIGTRGSRLAMAQAWEVCEKLEKEYPEHIYEIVVISTKGDQLPQMPLKEIGEKGIFVREIEKALLEDRIQLAVHSMKDMPTEPARGLVFSKMWKRQDPRDALVLKEASSLQELAPGAVLGTGSMRRECQLKRLRPDLRVVGIRGNVDTRLRKLQETGLDGIVLAAAGLRRLGMEEAITEYLEPESVVPACAQGALALQIKEGQKELRDMLERLADQETELCVRAERSFLKAAGGGCHIPAGAYGRLVAGKIKLEAVLGREDGSCIRHGVFLGTEPERLGRQAAEELAGQIGEEV